MEDAKENISETKPETVISEKNKPLISFDPEPKMSAPLYENVFYQNTVDDAGAFPLDMPTNVLEPPKEKPPPPPTDDQPDDDELLGNVSSCFKFIHKHENRDLTVDVLSFLYFTDYTRGENNREHML